MTWPLLFGEFEHIDGKQKTKKWIKQKIAKKGNDDQKIYAI